MAANRATKSIKNAITIYEMCSSALVPVPFFGASGPTMGSAAGVLLCQVIPNWIYVGRARRLKQGLGEKSP